MTEEKLKECPFCGHEPSWRLTKVMHCQLHGDEYQNHILGCFNPKCIMKPFSTEPTKYWCIKNWNTRK